MAVWSPAALSISATLVAALAAQPPARLSVAIYPPWWDAARVEAAATSAGSIAGVSRWPFLIPVYGADPVLLRNKLARSGAIFVIGASILTICASQPEENSR